MNWNRRQFVKATSVLAGASSCGLISMIGCTPVKYLAGEIKGKLLVVEKSGWGDADFILVANPQIPAPIFVKKIDSGYVAVLLECTHKQCEVRPNTKTLKCPCHGSEFAHNGSVLNGPAIKNLDSFEIWDDDTLIYIQ